MVEAIYIKSLREIELMRKVGALAAETLCAVGDIIKPGITTDDIDKFVVEDTLRKGAIAASLGYRQRGGGAPFPKSVRTSANEVVCHGIPSSRVLEDGDIVNIDITHIYQDYHGDTSATFYVGTPSDEARHVVETARECLALGIAEVRPGARLGDIAGAITEHATSRGCSVVRDFVGHGIGRVFHEPPSVSHFGSRGFGLRLKPGMIFTIEPMVNVGSWEVITLEDGWTAVTADGSMSAQFEHTLLVTDDGVEILTKRDRSLRNSEDV